MGDPERLLAAVSDGDELERELLGSIRNVSPPPGAKHAAWDAIAQVTSVAAAGAGAAVASGAAAHAAAGAKFFTAKVLIGVALVGSTVATGGYWVSRHSSQPVAVDPPAERRALPVPTPALPPVASPGFAAAPCDTAFPSAPCPPAASPGAYDRPPRASDEPRQKNFLRIESRMLTEARAQLRDGDPRAAMTTLEHLETRFPKGVMTQERNVLTIQVLAALGDVAGAKRRAKDFLEAYPQSPHASQLRRFAGDP